MTVAATTSRIVYPGAGSVGPFAFPFRIQALADLRVTKRDALDAEATLLVDDDWALSAGSSVGDASGSITLVDALAVGETLSIRRAPAVTQTSSFRNQGAYAASAHEDALDRTVMQLQKIQDEVDRSFGVLETIDPAGVLLRVRPEVGKVLAWQSSTQLGNSALDSSAIALPGEGRTVATASAYLLNNRVYNVLDYGALGDGVTNDMDAFKAAVDAAPEGATVWAPRTSAFYVLDISVGRTNAIVVDKRLTIVIDGDIETTGAAIQANPTTAFDVTGDNVTFMGSGTIRGDGSINDVNGAATDATMPSLVRVSGDYFSMSGLEIDTPYKTGIHLYVCWHAKILNNRFTGGPTTYSDTGYFGIRSYGGPGGGNGGRHLIANNQFYPDENGGMYVQCIFFSGTYWSVLDSNIAYRPYEKLAYLNGSYNVVSANIILGNTGEVPGSNAKGTIGAAIRTDGLYNKVVNNLLSYTGGIGAIAGGGITVSNNTVINSGGGIAVFDTDGTTVFDYIHVNNNVCVCANLQALVADGIYIAPLGGPSNYVQVQGNTVTGFSKADPIGFIPAWQASPHVYPKYAVVKPSVANGKYYTLDTTYNSGGISGAVEPVWPVVNGATIVDGGVRWICTGYETNTQAQVRLVATVGKEILRSVIANNILATGERGISLTYVTSSDISRNQIRAGTWGIITANCAANRYTYNPVEGASNVGISGLAASDVQLDYKTGDWTPQIDDAGDHHAAMANSSSNGGKYERHGNRVTLWGNVSSTSVAGLTAGNAVRITGAPYACVAGAKHFNGMALGEGSGLAIPAGSTVSGRIEEAAKYILLKVWDLATGSRPMLVSEWTDDGGLSFTLTYYTTDPY